MKKIVVLLGLTAVLNLGATDFTGTGFGESIAEAKSEALSDLSQSIKAEVRSSFENHKFEQKEGNSGSFSKSSVKVSSNLPIIGAEFELFDNTDNIEALVKLDPSKASVLYATKLQELLVEIDSLALEVDGKKSNVQKQKLLALLLNKLNEFSRYQSVAIVVGVEPMQQPRINIGQVQGQLVSLENDIDSLEMAGDILAKPFTKFDKIYIYPAKTSQSHEVTPFANALKMQLSSKLKTVALPADASYWLIGEYTQMKEGIVLSYALVDTAKREDIEASVLSLPSKAYKGLRTKPQSISFDKLLHTGIVVSDKLRVSINTNKGNDELLFRSKEEIKLMVKMTKMGYFYVVGYTQTKSGKHAYLLELEEAPSDAKFIKFVNADDTNKWLELGSFVVEAPYGVESLQVIASNHKFTSLPQYHYDEESEYYLIGKDVKEGLVKTRGLHKKKPKNKETIKSEAVLMFTTMQ